MHNLFPIKNKVQGTRGKLKLEHHHCNYVKYGKEGFSYVGGKLWNNLSADFKEVEIIVLSNPICQCSYCNLCI